MNKKLIVTIASLLSTTVLFSLNALAAQPQKQNQLLKSTNDLPPISVSKTEAALEKAAPNLKPNIINLALKAYNKGRAQGYDAKEILSVIDFSQPSYEKSLWVFNLKKDTLLFHTYVAHGIYSGLTTAKRFSNKCCSDASSLGLYLTGKTFYGNDGLSMRLRGLSGQFDDNIYKREVVMHGAWYVNQAFVNKWHRLGRSWGCPAVSKKMIKPITNKIKDGTLIFAYANNSNWLAHGPYVA